MALHHVMSYECVDDCTPPPSIPSTLSTPFLQEDPSKKHLSIQMIIIIAVVAATFFLGTYALIVKFSANWIMSRRAASQNNNTHDEEEEDDDDNGSQETIHHIWYINTVGLEESVINSITVCKYSKSEGLIDGTDCSVCLGEFQDGDDVRLLPKCSHAFHVPCIDAWLRSHVNCPLCRATVVSNTTNASPTNPNPDSLGAVGETQMGNSEAEVPLERNQSCRTESILQEREGEIELEDQLRDIQTGKENSSPVMNFGFRVQSDLSDKHRSCGLASGMSGNEIEPVRRSVSMDSVSASLVRIALTDHFPIDSEGSSSAVATQLIKNKKSKPGQLLRIKKAAPNQNQSMLKMVSVYSKGAFLQQPVAMKRSFSAGFKFLVPRHCRSRTTILPL